MKMRSRAIGLVLSGFILASLACLGQDVTYVGPAAPPEVQPVPVWDVSDLERLFSASPVPGLPAHAQDWAHALRPDSLGIVDLSMPNATGQVRENPWQADERPVPREIRFELSGTVRGPVAVAYLNGCYRKVNAVIEGWTFAAASGEEVLLQRDATLIRVPAGVAVTVRF